MKVAMLVFSVFFAGIAVGAMVENFVHSWVMVAVVVCPIAMLFSMFSTASR